MDVEWVRQHCLGFPHCTEHVQWGDNLVFKIGGKMFTVLALAPSPHWISFKCSEMDFVELVERPGILPAPYLARAHWVALETDNAMPRNELRRRIRTAYDLVVAGLPRKTRLALQV